MLLDAASRMRSINKRAALAATLNLLIWSGVIAGLVWAGR